MALKGHRPISQDSSWSGWHVPPHAWAFVLERDGHACRYCGASGEGILFEPDHVVPIRLGGATAIANLVTSCRPCNRDKGGHTVACWQDGKPCIATIPFPRYSKMACTSEAP